MRKIGCAMSFAVSAAFCSILSSLAAAQAVPTASRGLDISAFGGLTGNYTGLASGRNLDITAGIDHGFKPFLSWYPSLESRGSYPVYGGTVDRQKNILGGVKLSRFYGRLHPYGDVLFGRGKINYIHRFATPDPNFHYVRSVSNVFAFGGGIDFALSTHLLLKADGQFERYSTPATSSGHLFSKPITGGVVYRFSFGR